MEGSLLGIRGPIVFDSSALFNFGHRGHLELLLDRLAEKAELLLPKAVLEEASEQELNRQYYRDLIADKFQVTTGEVSGGHEEEIDRLSRELGSGELDVLVLTLQTNGTAIIDEPEARAAARSLGLNVTGTIGILLLAVRETWMTEEEALATIQKLRSGGFRIPAVESGQSLQEYVQSLAATQ